MVLTPSTMFVKKREEINYTRYRGKRKKKDDMLAAVTLDFARRILLQAVQGGVGDSKCEFRHLALYWSDGHNDVTIVCKLYEWRRGTKLIKFTLLLGRPLLFSCRNYITLYLCVCVHL